MSKRRALQEAAKDPLAKRETTIQDVPEKKSGGVTVALSVVAALAVGFVAGFISHRLFRFI